MEKGFCELNISQLVRADWNYKNDSPALAEKLANNIRRNGQVENIIVRELDTGLFEVVNGNHRLDVLRSLKFEKVFCYNLGRVSLAQAKRVAVETNETKFDTNNDIFEDVMREIVEVDGIDDILKTMPFSEDELNELLHINEIISPDEDLFIEEEDVDIDENETHTEDGDIYQLNRHRLICGDSTSKDVISKLFGESKANLVVTDPPYGVDYGNKNKMLNEFQIKDGMKRGQG